MGGVGFLPLSTYMGDYSLESSSLLKPEVHTRFGEDM